MTGSCHVLESPCESNEGNEGGDTLNQITDPPVHERHLTGVKPYECTKCGKIFTDLCFLLNQQRSRTRHKPHPCEECGKASSVSCVQARMWKQTLWRNTTKVRILGDHLRDSCSLSSKNSFHCKKCGKASTCHSSFLGHVRGHCGQKIHACKACGKAFRNYSYLTRHVRTHTGEKPYACKHCGKTFCCYFYLHEHVRTHTGEKPCEYKKCGKAFGVKPYECLECGKA